MKPYAGDNPFLRHGALRIVDDRRHFAHADGTWFLRLGDGGVPWESLYAHSRPEYFDAGDRRIQHLVDQA